MKKLLKVLKYLVAIVIIVVALLLFYVKTFLPSVGKAPEITVDKSAANIERGKYLANHVSVCMDCHSTRDWSVFSGPPIAGTEGKGGETFDQKLGFPGKFVANNITPYHLSSWTDGEIFRAITTGVSKNGRALFPIMPYHNFGKLDKKDVEAIIAYIRSIPSIQHETTPSSADFPMNFIINTMPQKANFTTIPNKLDYINYGQYVTNAAGCYDCHTKQEKGKFVGEPFAGGFEFKFPDGAIVRSYNITPDKATGIGTWTKEQFITTFKNYADSTYVPKKVKQGELQTPMPWSMYAGMTKEDLAAIYDYLQSLKAVNNKVEIFSK
jgi:mono/diheme cytochrome c family protein